MASRAEIDNCNGRTAGIHEALVSESCRWPVDGRSLTSLEYDIVMDTNPDRQADRQDRNSSVSDGMDTAILVLLILVFLPVVVIHIIAWVLSG